MRVAEWGRRCTKGAGLANFIKGRRFGDWFRDYQLSKKLSFKGLITSRYVIVIKINICKLNESITVEGVAFLHRISGVPVPKFRP